MQKRDQGTPANDLVLQIRGKATTACTTVIAYCDINDHNNVPSEKSAPRKSNALSDQNNGTSDARDFLVFDLPLASFGGVASPGVHVVPFAVVLPDMLPSTMKVQYLQKRQHSMYTYVSANGPYRAVTKRWVLAASNRKLWTPAKRINTRNVYDRKR